MSNDMLPKHSVINGEKLDSLSYSFDGSLFSIWKSPSKHKLSIRICALNRKFL